MKKIKHLFILLLLISGGCAITSQPEGGKKDLDPPSVVESHPEEGALNFKGDQIEIEFDEFFQLNNVNEKFYSSPRMEENPKITISGKTLKIHFQEPLKENSTYILNFDNAIKDIHEGTEKKDFTFAFSTGNVLDSLEIKGEVRDAFTGEPVKEGDVFLYKNIYDSVYFKEKPLYLARIREGGTFLFQYLKAGNYSILYLSDKNRNTLYDPGESTGFIPGTFTLNKDTSFSLLSFKEETGVMEVVSRETLSGIGYRIAFNKEIDSFSVNSPLNEGLYFDLSDSRDTLNFYYPSQKDSIPVNIAFPRNSLDFLIPGDVEPNNKKFKLTGEKSFLPGNKPLLKSKFPLKNIDENRFSLFEVLNDSMKIEKPVAAIIVGSANKKLQLSGKFFPGKDYLLILQDSALVNIYGGSSKKMDWAFSILETSDFGNLSLQVTGEYFPLIIQLLDEKKKINRTGYLKKEGKIEFRNLKSGDYSLRLIHDENQDRKWNPGSVIERKLSEKITLSPEPVTIRKNWDIEGLLIKVDSGFKILPAP